MIGEFDYDTVQTANPKQFVSIDKNDVKDNPDLAKAGKHLGDDFPSRCNIDNQVNMRPLATVTPFYSGVADNESINRTPLSSRLARSNMCT